MWGTILLIGLATAALLGIVRYLCVTYYHKRNIHYREVKGKLVVITGGTSGIGRDTVREMFFNGATVVFLGRRHELVKNVIVPSIMQQLTLTKASKSYSQEEIHRDIIDIDKGVFDAQGNFTSRRLYYRKCDLADLTQIKAFAEYVRTMSTPVHILIHNAGAVFNYHKKTAQDFESTIGINVISHYYLTELLFDNLDSQARVICVSSMMNKFIDDADLNLNLDKYLKHPKAGYFNWAQYARSKLAFVLFAAGVQKIMESKNMNAKCVSLNPGAIMTDFIKNMHPFIYYSFLTFKLFAWCFMKNPNEGAQTTLHCSMIPFDKLKGGQYYSDCQEERISRAVNSDNIKGIMNGCKDLVESATKTTVRNLRFE